MLVYGLYAIPSYKLIDTFYYREEVLPYVRQHHPTALYGHPGNDNTPNSDVIYTIDTVFGEPEERFFVAAGEDWYFELLHHEDKYSIPDSALEPHGHGVND